MRHCAFFQTGPKCTTAKIFDWPSTNIEVSWVKQLILIYLKAFYLHSLQREKCFIGVLFEGFLTVLPTVAPWGPGVGVVGAAWVPTLP